MTSPRAALALLLASLALAGAALARTDLLASFEQKSLDWRFTRFPSDAPRDPGLTLVLVDQASLDALEADEIHWPWPRDLYAAVAAFARARGAKAVVFDILFDTPSPYGRDQDLAFAAELKRSTTVLAAAGKRPPLPVLRAAASAVGDAAARPDPDGVFRRLPLASAAGAGPSLAAAAAAAAGGSLDGLPLEDGALALRFRRRNAYPALSAGRVVRAWADLESGAVPELDGALFKDRVVLVGLSAPGLRDLRPTPVNPVAPGTEVVAAAVDNILTRDFLRRAPRAARVLVALLALALGAFAASRPGRPARSAAAAGLVSAFLAAAAVAAFRLGWHLDMVLPQLALWSAYGAVSAWGYAVEGRRTREIQRAFSLYLAPEVVRRIAADPSALALGGERRELSFYFSDIENFTNFSEKLTPERLTALMNRYLDEMTDTILASGGTLDKYIGDAVMAFWGAPLPHPGHALTACKAALRNQERLAVLREALVKEGFPVVKARIGLNTGPASVGNLGSSRRFSYTALGDDVNLASRLEGANKVYGTYILVSHATRQGAGAEVVVRELDLLKVKGKDKAVPVYELLGLAGAVPSAVVERARRFEEALALCRARRFKDSLAAFESYGNDHGLDKAAALYIERCRTLLKEPPPEDWDGSFALTEK